MDRVAGFWTGTGRWTGDEPWAGLNVAPGLLDLGLTGVTVVCVCELWVVLLPVVVVLVVVVRVVVVPSGDVTLRTLTRLWLEEGRPKWTDRGPVV